MLVIGLTGGIGAGKSTTAYLFSERGAPVIDADNIAHNLVQPGSENECILLEYFGIDILSETDLMIDRKKLQVRLFNSPQDKLFVENVLHPQIRYYIEKQLKTIETPYVIVVVPLLVEARFMNLVDRILVVDTTEQLQIKRVMNRNQLTQTEVENVMAHQATRMTRLMHADDLIMNVDGLASLKQQVAHWHDFYIEQTEAER